MVGVVVVVGHAWAEDVEEGEALVLDGPLEQLGQVLLIGAEAARQQLGFEAKTSLEEGLRRTLQWYRTTAKVA